MEKETKKVVANTTVVLENSRDHESNLANFIADAFVYHVSYCEMFNQNRECAKKKCTNFFKRHGYNIQRRKMLRIPLKS